MSQSDGDNAADAILRVDAAKWKLRATTAECRLGALTANTNQLLHRLNGLSAANTAWLKPEIDAVKAALK